MTFGSIVERKEPEKIVDEIKEEFREAEATLKKREEGVTKKVQNKIWVNVKKKNLRNFINFLEQNYQYPHFTVIVGNDEGDQIAIRYHLSLYHEEKYGEISIMLEIDVSKDDLVLPTITDLIPGALTAEREIQEMFGIEVEDIPDDRHIYLPYNQPDNEYPWRKDEKGPEMVDLYDKDKNTSEDLNLYSKEKIEEFNEEEEEEGEGEEEEERKYVIDPDKCVGCTQCVPECPVEAISGKSGEPHTIDRDKCIACGVCADVCPVNAISKEGEDNE